MESRSAIITTTHYHQKPSEAIQIAEAVNITRIHHQKPSPEAIIITIAIIMCIPTQMKAQKTAKQKAAEEARAKEEEEEEEKR